MGKVVTLGFGVLAWAGLSACGEDDGCTPAAAGGNCIQVGTGADVQRDLQSAFIKAKRGDTVELGEGTFNLTLGLTLDASDVTVRGKGMDKTILSFKSQEAGAEGIHATGDSLVFEDFSIQDTKGDALKVEGANGVTFRRMKVEWTGGPLASNGAYGLYPVQCTHVLVEDSVAIGASDAGIYVGQSNNIIVRRSRAEYNVAGIEIENSRNADVYDNEARNNAGGILVFDLPGLQVKDGGNVRVYNNRSIQNNTKNFAPAGNIVAMVPKGTGMLVMANDNVEIFGNTIQDNDTAQLAVISYWVTQLAFKDMDAVYDPYPVKTFIHDNTFIGGGGNPDITKEIGIGMKVLFGSEAVPDILYDGIKDPARSSMEICLQNNTDGGFADLQLNPNDILDLSADRVIRDVAAFTCSRSALPAVSIPGVQ
ncbi:MAG: right-handed parallel beta-helix repeat-containing protein [Nitrospirae bacterium]|nr:right-handed parallel beta-helix repeat-containing protein [Nitrospirota bacterium]